MIVKVKKQKASNFEAFQFQTNNTYIKKNRAYAFSSGKALHSL